MLSGTLMIAHVGPSSWVGDVVGVGWTVEGGCVLDDFDRIWIFGSCLDSL